jgi:F-type H+-transporting ATPase subunit delta
MVDSKVARRYAKSLLGLASERNLTEKVFTDMELVASVCKNSRDFALLMKNPIVNTDKKDAVLKAVFTGKVDTLTLSFMDLMTRKGRESYFEGIAAEYIKIYKELKGVQVAYVKTATPLDATTREEILSIVRRTKGDKVELVESVDPSLIGGFILRVGDEQFDASVTKKLRQLKNEFDDNLYVREI